MTNDELPPRLRARLDEELTTVRSTAVARDRLNAALRAAVPDVTARTPDPSPDGGPVPGARPVPGTPPGAGWSDGRRRRAVLVPLAAAAVVCAVIVPVFLRSGSGGQVPAAPAASAAPIGSPTQPPADQGAPTGGPTPTGGPIPTAATSVTAKPVPSVTDVRVGVRSEPDPATVNDRVTLEMTGLEAGTRRVTVHWGDRSAVQTLAGKCGTAASAVPVAGHRYAAAGRYRVTVTVLDCAGESRNAAAEIAVSEVASPRSRPTTASPAR